MATSRESPPDASSAGTTKTSSVEPASWQEQFLSLVNNTRTTAVGEPLVPDSGFVLLTHGSPSLQHVQALCHGAERSLNTCLTARYRLNPPILSNLLAAFVGDVARLAAGPDGAAPVGDLLPVTRSLTARPWDALQKVAADQLAARAGLDQPAGQLTDAWISELFTGLGAVGVLRPDERLVLFAEVDGPVSDGDLIDLLVAALPTRVGIVVSGVRALPSSAALRSTAATVHLIEETVDLDIEPADLGRVFAYVDSPLAGDQPADLDAMDRRRYARGLARLVMLPDTGPMTIGVHAPWGQGKSSFMRFIEWELVRIAAANVTQVAAQADLAAAEATLANAATRATQRTAALHKRARILNGMRKNAVHDVIPVWFNAWRYDGATQIWAGLTHEITEQMEHTLPRTRRISTRFAYAKAKQQTAFWLGGVAPVAAAILLTTLALLVVGQGTVRDDVAEKLPDWAGWFATLAPWASTLAIVLYLVWRFSRMLTPVSERLLDYVRSPNYREHMGYQNHVLRDLTFLKGRLAHKGKQPRIVIFIDDLDRCSDKKVLETLQAINLLLTASDFYVFLGIDTDMIVRAVAREYQLAKDDVPRAESYLQKIIQLSFRLPDAVHDQRFALLAEFFSDEARSEHLERSGQGSIEQSPPAADQPAIPQPRDGAAVPGGTYTWNSLSVRTPPVFEVAQVRDTADELDAFALLSDVLPNSPRELKRLGNVHRLVKILVQRPEAPPTVADQRLLVAWLICCFVHPAIAAQLLSEARGVSFDSVLRRQALAGWIIRLNDNQPEADKAVLTEAQLAPGTPLAEAAAISSLFQDLSASSPQSAP